MRHLGNRERQCVISAAGTALPDNESYTDSYEYTAKDCRRQRIIRQIRQKIREKLPEIIKGGDAERGQDGHLDKTGSQKP